MHACIVCYVELSLQLMDDVDEMRILRVLALALALAFVKLSHAQYALTLA